MTIGVSCLLNRICTDCFRGDNKHFNSHVGSVISRWHGVDTEHLFLFHYTLYLLLFLCFESNFAENDVTETKINSHFQGLFKTTIISNLLFLGKANFSCSQRCPHTIYFLFSQPPPLCASGPWFIFSYMLLTISKEKIEGLWTGNVSRSSSLA